MITARTLPDHTRHQDAPHLHARPSGLSADPRKDVLVQKPEQSLAEGLIGTEVLKPRQQGRDVIPGSGIQPDVRGANLAEHLPWIAYVSHACLVKIGRNRPVWRENGPKPVLSPDSSL